MPEGLFEKAAGDETALTTSVLVVAEIVWVLEGYYALPRPRITSAGSNTCR